MKKRNQKTLYVALCVLLTFVLWTILIRFVDVKTIGPQESAIGFATINGFFHKLTGINLSLYYVTDWLSLIPLGIVIFFALLGLIQWIKRKSIKKVDYSIFILGGFYITVIAVYLLFETVVINYRPILINGNLEVSYPSSTTVLVLCVMTTAIMQLNERLKNKKSKRIIASVIIAFMIFMIIGRLVSGVHWLTDILGGVILSAGLVTLYRYIIGLRQN